MSCEIDGCGKPHQARGLCAYHYNVVWRQEKEGTPSQVECGTCGRRVGWVPAGKSPWELIDNHRCGGAA